MLTKFIATLAATSGLLLIPTPSQASVFNFSFTNEDGSIPGTVTGEIDVADISDGTTTLDSLTILSAPDGLTFPATPLTGFFENSVTISGGEITDITVTPSVIGSDILFSLDSDFFTPAGTFLGAGSFSTTNGVFDADSSTLTFSSASAPTNVPEPGTILALLVGTSGILIFKTKKI